MSWDYILRRNVLAVQRTRHEWGVAGGKAQRLYEEPCEEKQGGRMGSAKGGTPTAVIYLA